MPLSIPAGGRRTLIDGVDKETAILGFLLDNVSGHFNGTLTNLKTSRCDVQYTVIMQQRGWRTLIDRVDKIHAPTQSLTSACLACKPTGDAHATKGASIWTILNSDCSHLTLPLVLPSKSYSFC